jgi:hypothetical protein
MFEIHHYARLEMILGRVFVWTRLPLLSFLFHPLYFTDVSDPHVGGFFNLLPPLQEMCTGSGVQRREQPRPRGGALPLP